MTKSGRLVSGVNGAVALGMVAVLAAVALVVRPPAPPGIAEFAPQATKPITRAPQGQSAQAGEGPGGAGAGGAPSPSSSPSAAAAAGAAAAAAPGGPDDPKGVPSSVQCHTWPDGSVTQTFDPQSPPCIASWPEADQGNGGATTAGVSATEIRVVVPRLEWGQAPWDSRLRALERFFNSHYQFYGRQLRFIAIPKVTGNDPSVQKAAADSVVERKPFAALDVAGQVNADFPVYRSHLVRSKIITTTVEAPSLTPQELLESSPYLWQFNPTIEETQSGFVEFACKNLRGSAEYGGADVQTKPRRYAILRQEDPNVPAVPRDVLVRGLAACTGEAPETADLGEDCGDARSSDSINAAERMQALRTGGVTTIVLLGMSSNCPHQVAGRIGYHPEWAIVPTLVDHYDESMGAAAADQNKHTFGILPSNKWLGIGEPVYQAVNASDPRTGSWAPVSLQVVRPSYQQLSMLAAGIQMAGPRLTPESFAEALEQTRFPNPGAAGPRWYQARVGFAPADHTFVDDLGVWWWDNTVKSSWGEAGGGGLCYVQRGRRWLRGQWPADLELQQGPCR